MLTERSIDAVGIAAMEDRVRARIADAVAFAQASAWPAAETLTDHAYA